MRASILLFVTALVLTTLNLNVVQNSGVSFSEDSESTTLLACKNTRGCRQYRGSGRRDRMASNNAINDNTLVQSQGDNTSFWTNVCSQKSPIQLRQDVFFITCIKLCVFTTQLLMMQLVLRSHKELFFGASKLGVA